MRGRFIGVAVPVPLHKTFVYRLPDGVDAAPGARVAVSFGPRRLVGVVVEAATTEPPEGIAASRLKTVTEVIDPEPLLDRQMLELCRWMAAYYHLPPGEAYTLPLPPAMIGGRRGSRERTDDPWLTEIIARWAAEPAAGERLGTRQDAVLSWLREHREASAPAIRDATGAGRAVLQRLAARGLIVLEERRVPRDRFAGLRTIQHPPPALTGDQTRVVETVTAALGGYRGFLLVGVTGSGKTEVYLRLIDRVRARGEGALVLVPEIALTPQLVQRFRARLGDDIAVLHSGLDARARHEQWLGIAAGELRVVIGARSALFAPLQRPGLIVVDEEHDGSFKQDSAPRYHARDLALVRGHLAGCPVVLGTATPSLESWANVARGKLTRVELPTRALDRPMPSVELVDLRDAPPVDPQGIFSQRLLDDIRANVAAGEQTILFLNRRGYAAFVLCRACGEALACPSCAVTLTWHQRRGRLVCHYCDRVDHLPDRCAACSDDALQPIGFGTEQVQDVLARLVPEARVARMDRDTTRGAALTKLLEAFRRRRLDVLVGTQMVAKGHDFPGVTLVGVLLAEMGLRLPDFRAAERTFQLLTQIAGRAGRAERPGRVLIQTFAPDHYALRYAVAHDSRGFLDEELGLRRDHPYPPWAHLAVFRLRGPDQPEVVAVAEATARALRTCAPRDVVVMGPLPAPIERVQGRWRYRLLIRAASRASLAPFLDRAMELIEAERRPARVQIALDVDPYSFL